MEVWTNRELMKRLNSGETGVVFLFAPLCGTCQIAEQMVKVAKELTSLKVIGKADLNYLPNLAKEIQIESVPCLLFFTNNTIMKKIYAFHSVQYVFEEIEYFHKSYP